MFLKQRKSSTDPRLRSLLQKAVRRGYVDLAETTARRLHQLGDRVWLRSRAAVITFEEVWPLASTLVLDRGEDSKICALAAAAVAEKYKDAAGLGSLAYANHEEDRSVQECIDDMWPVRVVSEGLRRPQEFFDWAIKNASTPSALGVIYTAKRYLAAATWGWDKTCILAGAFLGCTQSVPAPKRCSSPTKEFPLWVALDKHTPEGKAALRRVGTRLRVPYRKLIWAGFYCESAVTNASAESPWWEMEKAWRLRKARLTIESASELWQSARRLLQAELAPAEERLRRALVPQEQCDLLPDGH